MDVLFVTSIQTNKLVKYQYQLSEDNKGEVNE